MEITSLVPWLMGIFLISIRLSMLFVSTPIFGGVPMPTMAKIVLIVGLSVVFSGTVHFNNMQPFDILWLIEAIVHEVIVGACIASGLIIGFAAFHFGGRLLDYQIGYGISGLFDMATRNNMPLLGTVISMTALLIFFAADGHVVMLRVLQLSFTKLPVGTSLSMLNLGALIAYFGTCFTLGFAIVAPIVLCLFILDLGVAFMSRTMPQMNVFVMSLALKVIVGLIMLAIVLPFAGGLINKVFESIFNNWDQVLG